MRLTKRQAKEIQALKGLKEDEIDFSDIPVLQNWHEAVIGKFYRPVKKSLTIRVDADVLARLRTHGKGYQTRINALLRQAVENPSPGAIRIRLTECALWPKRGFRHER